MNIKDLHPSEKVVSAISLFKSELGNASAIQIKHDEQLKEHISQVPALLICLEGQVVFHNENGMKEILNPGDFVHIEPNIKHWVEGIITSQLILIK
jgi:quercetin dioxygenase-like cupin family protein